MIRKPLRYTVGNPAVSDRNRPTSVIEQRPQLSEGAGTSFPTDANLDAQLEWLAHIEAGRIEVR